MGRSPKRPVVPVGSARLRAVAGPRPTPAGKAYRWRLEWYPKGHDGKQCTRALGWGTRAQAIQQANQLAAEGLPGPPGAAGSAALGAPVVTVQDLLEVWLGHEAQRAEQQQISSRTAAISVRAARRLAGSPDAPRLRGVRLARLTQRRIEAHRDRRVRAGDAPATVDLDLLKLWQALRWGDEHGLVDTRSLRRVRAGRRDATRYERRIPAADEVQATLDQLRAPWHRRAVLLLWATGARPGEACAATWGDLDGDLLTLGNHAGAAKTGRRTVPLPPSVLQALGTRQPGGVRLIGSDAPAAAAVGGALRHALRAACDRAGVPHWTPKGLRRALARDLMEQGTRPAVYEATMGHSYEMGRRVYDEASADDQRRAVAAARAGGLLHGRVLAFPGGG